ncbi:MAG TPA: hypothetical protein VMY41_17410 [Thermohalobaculum sp.]|nr:hypothetical protein [Thermohalobaculum sp.]
MTDREPSETGLGDLRIVPAPPEPPAPRKSIPWREISEGFSAVRSAILNFLLLVSLVAMVYFAVEELRRDVVVIDPIRLPDTLRKAGYTEDVAADRLWDALARINVATPTAKDLVGLLPASQKTDFEPPGSGIALQEVVQMLRRFLRLDETRIVGEITCMTEKCEPGGLALRLRVYRSDGIKSDPINVLSKSTSGDETIRAAIEEKFGGERDEERPLGPS